MAGVMPKPIAPDALATLRQVNANLGSALDRLRPEGQHCSAVKANDLSDLRGEILRASGCVPRISLNSEAAVELKNELLEYSSILEKLKHILPPAGTTAG